MSLPSAQGEAVVIALIVDVEQNPPIFDFHFKYRVANDWGRWRGSPVSPSSDMWPQERRAGRVVRDSPVYPHTRESQSRPRPVIRHDLVEGLGPNEGLVPEDNEGGGALGIDRRKVQFAE